MNDNTERLQGGAGGQRFAPFPPDEKLSEQEERARLALRALLQRHARAQELARNPEFTDEDFIVVVLARCIRLRKQQTALLPVVQEFAIPWARLMEEWASMVPIFGEIPPEEDTEELREDISRVTKRLDRALDALAGTKAMRRCWETLDNVSIWVAVHLAEIAQQLFAAHRGGTGLDLGLFLVELARTVPSEAAGCSPKNLADLYRAWDASRVPSRAREHAGVPKGSKWEAASKFFREANWGKREPDAIRIEYGKHAREVCDSQRLALFREVRWGMWILGFETLQRLGVETVLEDWERGWRSRRNQCDQG